MTSNPQPVLVEVEHLARRFGPTEAVKDVTLALARGRVLGLLGINGAGKTTTLRLLAGILAPDRGRVRVAGKDIARDPGAQRDLVAYAPEHPALYLDSTPREALTFAAKLRGFRGARLRAAVEAALTRGDLTVIAHRLIGKLSRGQQQRVGLAQSLLHEPALILLDEPTAGLDPVQAAATRSWITSLRENSAVIVSTHLLGDVRACCDDVAVLHEGRIAFSGPLDAWLADDAIEVRFDQPVPASLFSSLPVARVVAGENAHHWWLTIDPARVGEITRHAAAQGVGVTLLRPRVDVLEQRFAELVAGRATSSDSDVGLALA